MFRRSLKLLSLGAVALGSVSAFGQTFDCIPFGGVPWSICINPENTNPYSPNFSIGIIAEYVAGSPQGCDDTPLFNITVGRAGTVAYGGEDGPCFDPGFSMQVSGAIGFAIGSRGSIHTNIDDFLQLTFGMPIEPGNAGGYAAIVKGPDNTRTRIGTNGFSTFIRGLSDRYIIAETSADNVDIALRVDVVGDAARLDWTLRNLADGSENIGFWFGKIGRAHV